MDIGDYPKHFSVCMYVANSFNDGIDVRVVSEMTCTAATSDHLQISLEKPESYPMTKGCEWMLFEVLAILGWLSIVLMWLLTIFVIS